MFKTKIKRWKEKKNSYIAIQSQILCLIRNEIFSVYLIVVHSESNGVANPVVFSPDHK